jgi:hypothetical protein
MARYNTVSSANTVTSTGTVAVPAQGLFTQFTGTAPYTVTIPNPTIYFGETQTFYNATAGVITITTPSGIFKGPSSSGTSSQTIPTLTTITLASDGTNYVIINENGGALVATTINASAAVALSPANANVVISPSGSGVVTINPATTGTMDNVNVGVTVAGSGKFTTLTASTGQIQSTAANNAATGSGQLYLNGTTGNRIDFNTNGLAAPAFTTRAAGTKIVFYPNISASAVDFAMGMDSSTLWYSVPTTGDNHRWYGGTTNTMTLTGSILTINKPSGGVDSGGTRFGSITTSTKLDLHISSATGGTSATATKQYGISFTQGAGNTQAAIVCAENGSDGTALGFFTTGNYSTGPQYRGGWQTDGMLVPAATNTYDLGTSSLRWRNIYTQDLHLSNGIGDYTMIEGEENLYLTNNKTGKAFKFALIEVDPTEVPPKSAGN